MKKIDELLDAILLEDIPDEARRHIELARIALGANERSPEQADFAPSGFFKIPGYQNYAINREGDVYSRKKKNGLVSAWTERSGHLRVELRDRSGARDKRYVHDLVLTTFHGMRPPGTVACHRNDVPTDNRLENLYWGSRRDNSKDFHRNVGSPTLSVEMRNRIELALRDGISQAEIARAFAVSQSTISRIANGLI